MAFTLVAWQFLATISALVPVCPEELVSTLAVPQTQSIEVLWVVKKLDGNELRVIY